MTSMTATMSRRAALGRVSSAALAGLGLALLPSAAEAAPLRLPVGSLGPAPPGGDTDGSPVEQARVVVVGPRRRRVCWWRRGRRVCAWR